MHSSVRGMVWLALPLCAVLVVGIEADGDDRGLIRAVKEQNHEEVLALVKRGVDVNLAQADGSTALHWTAYRDDPALTDLLLRAGARANVRNEFGATPLWVASSQGSAAVVVALLKKDADPNLALPNGETPLMAASRAGNAEAVRALVGHGATTEATEQARGQTALMWAVAQRHPAVVGVLIEHGANVHARSWNRRRRVKVAGADETPNASVAGAGETPNASVFEAEQGGYSPLLFAARVGDVQSARLLLAAGANVNDAAPSGTSAVVVAAHSGHTAMTAFLLDNGADPNAAGAGYTALHAAVLRGEVETVKTLLVHGADPNRSLLRATPVRRRSIDWAMNQAWLGATPFWLAAKFSEIPIMRLLVSGGANPLLVNKVGTTPLMAAIAGSTDRLGESPADGYYRPRPDPVKEDRDILEALAITLEHGIDVNLTNEAGATALHLAAARRLVAVVQFLLENGARVDVKNKRDQTALGMTSVLLRRGDQVEQADDTGLRSTDKTVALLRQFGAKE